MAEENRPVEHQVDVDEEKAARLLAGGYEEAAKIVQDEDRLERLLQRLEKKLSLIPVAGDMLSKVPAMVSLVRSYAKGEYRDLPLGSVLAIVAAILYVVNQVDLIPDFIPGAGYLDDAAVLAVCLKLVGDDVDEYVAWRKANGKQFDLREAVMFGFGKKKEEKRKTRKESKRDRRDREKAEKKEKRRKLWDSISNDPSFCSDYYDND